MSGKSRAVLIGTSTYSDAGLPDIPQVGPGLTELSRVFTELGLVESATTVLDEPSIGALGRGLTQAMAGADDLLLVYYIGHGLVGRAHDLYLGMHDSEPGSPEFGSLSYNALRDRVLDSPATIKVVILDCCFSGRAFGTAMSAPVDELVIDGTYVLTSAPPNRVSLVLPDEPHTAFTGRLLRLLDGGIPGAGEYVTIDDVYRHLLVTMRGEGLPLPQKRSGSTADRLRIRNRATMDTADDLRDRVAAVVVRARDTTWASVVDDLADLHSRQIRLLHGEHPDVLRTFASLLFARAAAGDPAKSGELLRELILTQGAVVGFDHPDLLRTVFYTAICLGESDNGTEAIARLRTLAPMQRSYLGYEHEDTCRTQHALARYLARTGEYVEASALLEELGAIRERTLDPASPTLAVTRRDIDVVGRAVRGG
ncbi:caspase family protein [Actinokineospora baliensis]|uniref:caspase family protein n=1 Tax=Actinokineospora baliensis TaxID=547056 RepID=UPI001EF97DD3|nr:tetratricopeptide repeat protein [Actinokineospora baliensis]